VLVPVVPAVSADSPPAATPPVVSRVAGEGATATAAACGAGVTGVVPGVAVVVTEVVWTNAGSCASRRATSRSRHEATTVAVSADVPAAATMIFHIVALRFVRASEVSHRGFVGSMVVRSACDMPTPSGRAVHASVPADTLRSVVARSLPSRLTRRGKYLYVRNRR